MTRGRIRWYRGDSYSISLTVKNKALRAAIDITGYTFVLTVSSEENPSDDTGKKFSIAGVLDDDPTTGKVYFTPTATNTDMDPAEYFYDVQMIDGDSNVRTIVKNKFVIVQDITKTGA